MKVFIILSAVIALTVAKPTFFTPIAYNAPVAYTYTAPVVPVEVSSQYHSQDSLGQYSYGYTGALSSKTEAKTFDGVTRGAYTYVDSEGKLQNVQYTADDVNGFRVAATNLPVAPAVPAVKTVEEPKPVEDTPEVAKAKVEHFAAVEEAKARVAAAPVEVAAPVVSYTSPVVTSYTGYPYNYYNYQYQPYSAYYPYQYQPGFGHHFSAVAPSYAGYYPFVTPGFGAPFAPVATPVASPAAPAVAPGSPVDEDTVEVKAAKKE